MKRKLFLNAILIDGNGGKPIHNSGMLVEGHHILSVGGAEDFSRCDGDIEIFDCCGKTIMPGMINGHVHIFMEPYTWDRVAYLQNPISSVCIEIIKNLEKTLHSGVTYIRDLGGVFDLDIQFREYVNDGKVQGPGMIADLIKIMPTAGYSRPKMRVNHNIIEDTVYMSSSEIKAAADEAHKMGKIIAAHCYGFAGIYNSVMNGADTIEHGQFRAPYKDEARTLADEMALRGTWLVPTLSAFFKEYNRYEVEEKYTSVIESFRLCHKAGVKIAMGTDAGVPWVGHDKAALELEHMTLYGMSSMEAICASTKSAAEMLGIIKEYGTLESGKFADFLILDGNPLEDIKVLQGKLRVCKHGTLI